jgi:hypothetical protein
MAVFRVMICDAFVNVEADSEAAAEAMLCQHIKDFPPGHPDSKITLITWQDDSEVADITAREDKN